jgi:sigma-54 dependent transcriptional regulator, acetoin dehydrogenase operon transcriptional activator AcoR
MGSVQPATHEALPIGRAAQRVVHDAWSRLVREHGAPLLHSGAAPHTSVVRRTIASSWQRSHGAGVTPLLSEAPVALVGDALEAARRASGWLGDLDTVLASQRAGYIGADHMLAVFNTDGCMLAADGDPRTLDLLADINFRPGALWSEATVGTNGPGTALALQRAVHVVGAEHFCEQWQAWHCASVPVRDPGTGELLGVIDLSGARDAAHPYALTMATAIAVALEQRLATRDAEQRTVLLLTYARLIARYPGDSVLAVDRTGRIVADSDNGGRDARRLSALGAEGRALLASLTSDRASNVRIGAPRDVSHPLLGGPNVALHPVEHDGRPAGLCLVFPRSAGTSSRGTEVRSATRIRPATVRYRLDDLIGEAPAMQDVRRLARACARTDLPVLLLGESGTGKEVLAQSIHDESPRRDGPFVAVNCAALPRELMESELFGHAGGAFTGARREGSMGKFQAAEGGTLFLDEVAELSPAAQAALLRVLQEGEVTRLGEHVSRAHNARVIAATNRDVLAAVADGRLRDDLYHRLDVLSITLPPLRARREDIARLAQRFLDSAPANGTHHFTADVVSAFATYAWPGNVRELRNVVHRMVTLAESSALGVHDLPPALRTAVGAMSDVATRRQLGIADTAGGAAAPTSRAGREAPANASEDAADFARAQLAHAITQHATMADAATALGITRSTLYRRLARYGLLPGRAVRAR